jgi:acetyl esterase/lipase
LLRYLRNNADALGIDSERIGLWAASGNVLLALSVLMGNENASLRCAVLCYGYMMDLHGSANVAKAATTWGFANPCTGKTVDDLPPQVPLLIVRAGMDQTPHLNETIDAFVANGLRRNLPLTLVNHATGPHAFDIFHDSETSREIIRQILGFMRFHLLEAAISIQQSAR